ncbi:carph-isopro domain-containing protein [Zavarzinia sp.]|uniref:carph-isopro domain-containing protein n=1 Tax=Zavarzinia sp. TaxID=2027920 RepID=UPI003BB495A4
MINTDCIVAGMESVASIIALWPSAEEFARDLGELGVTVRQWRRRGAIPPRHWNGIARAAQRRGLPGITIQCLADIAAAGPSRVADGIGAVGGDVRGGGQSPQTGVNAKPGNSAYPSEVDHEQG